ncbi:MAG: cyclic nucleotide-binding domain-containing protein [Bauldia sp.]|uniref:Crp/Fnr family transcriptional regulator n=1 Tax=Bauldia sp. TaxID=2575872 RepID=UPI001D1BBB69|nr:cyclic nucleotide-binding domain-containing protein [Bauldia sp.]MCB1496018.1 cyclic nucleotide-binding domain-containing protein [Bauldia sp.]
MNNKTSFEILDNADVPSRHAAAGEVILAAGSDSKEMFIIRKGTVAISVGGKVVEEVGHGGIFGEMGLIDFETRSADAIAVEDCDLVPIDERLFVVLVQETPYFALDVMRTLVHRIRTMNALLSETQP